MQGVAFEPVNYSGHTFADFEVRRDHKGPGWFIFGRNSEKYGRLPDGRGAYVKLCAWPDRPRRRVRGWNAPVQCGWPRKRDAQAVADAMNGKA